MSLDGSNIQGDRVSQIMDYLNDPTLDTLPDSLKGFKYTEGFDPDRLEEELQEHPFFMTELPDPSKPLPPLLDAFQQLKYSETDNTPHELACNHREDGVYHFKLKKYRIASTCFTTAIGHELKSENVDKKFVAQLLNNRSACSWFLRNYRSCVNDCKAALGYDPSYFKPFKRAVLCLVELGKWEEVEGMCGGWEEDGEEQFQFICSMRVKAREGKVKDQVLERRREVARKGEEDSKVKLAGLVEERGIRVRDQRFLDSEAASGGRCVAVGEGGVLTWPVLFMYPQYSQSDLVEAFSENSCFADHLAEMLDGDNSPPWDVDKEYALSNVDVYYLGDKFVRVDVNDSLLNVMKEQSYVLPGNGVPCFFVLAKGNEFCQDFIERVEVE